jgi:hypothetical protein
MGKLKLKSGNEVGKSLAKARADSKSKQNMIGTAVVDLSFSLAAMKELLISKGYFSNEELKEQKEAETQKYIKARSAQKDDK